MNRSEIIDRALESNPFAYAFLTKPIIVGGLAMEFHGIRPHGSDIDMIVTDADYQALKVRFPQWKKDVWGDLGISSGGYELFRSIWKLDYGYFSRDVIEFDRYMVISLDRLLLMKALSRGAGEKHRQDFDLILRHVLDANQVPEYVRHMNDRVSSYLAHADGIVYNEEY